MKNLISIFLVAVATMTMTSCHRDQVAIQKLNDIVTNFELQYEQLTDEQMAVIESDYITALGEIAKFRYSQADNERIGAIKARYDKTKLKYEVISTRRKAGDLFHQIIGYGEELIEQITNDSI